MTDAMTLIDRVADGIRAAFAEAGHYGIGEDADKAATYVVAVIASRPEQPDHDLLEQAARRVHYLSTYCIHGLHDECKGACKHDKDELCRCRCHAPAFPRPEPG